MQLSDNIGKISGTCCGLISFELHAASDCALLLYYLLLLLSLRVCCGLFLPWVLDMSAMVHSWSFQRCNPVKDDNKIKPALKSHTCELPRGPRWRAWNETTYSTWGVSRAPVFHTVLVRTNKDQGFLQAYNGSEQLCVLHILAGIHFALGGFPWRCHMLHVSSNCGGGGHSLTHVCMYPHPRRC